MKVINLGRGQGKTTRLLYASEFNNTPILCTTVFEKNRLMQQAKMLRLEIPEPITVDDVTTNKLRDNKDVDNGILIDEAPSVIKSLLNHLGVRSGEVKAITLTEKE